MRKQQEVDTAAPAQSDVLPWEHDLTHTRYSPLCEACVRAKTRKRQCRRQVGAGDRDPPTEFGGCITADHIIVHMRGESVPGAKVTLVAQDQYTQMLGSFPSASKSADQTIKGLQSFVGKSDECQEFYTDGSPELANAATHLRWRHTVATPFRPQTNGVAESAVRRVIEGTRACLYRSGLKHGWWDFASQAFCSLRNFSDMLPDHDGKTPYELKFGEPCRAKLIPFGMRVEYIPLNPERV